MPVCINIFYIMHIHDINYIIKNYTNFKVHIFVRISRYSIIYVYVHKCVWYLYINICLYLLI